MEKALKFLMWTLGIFVFLCLLGRALLFETWTVPDDRVLAASVAPTLNAGDFVLVLTVGESDFGDLVRCPDPEDENRYVVGRIVGMPNDKVEVKGRAILVNGTRYDSQEACKETTFTVEHPDTGAPTEMMCSRAELGGSWHYRGTDKQFSAGNDARHDNGPQHVYLLSDDRDLHDDSRDFGALSKESCNQRIFFRLWGGGGWTDGKSRLTVIR
jgi:signal peptidase I